MHLKEHIVSFKSLEEQFFLLRVNSYKKVVKNKSDRVTSPESVPIHLKDF